jgi:hypothetical protein
MYATNEELRKGLPGAIRDLPEAARRRFETATAAAREASALRRAEIMRELEAHGADHPGRRSLGASPDEARGLPAVEERSSEDPSPSRVVRRDTERTGSAAPADE